MPPLSDIRILDLSRVLAGPYATQLLADLGADVIKVERPGRGDDARQYGPPFARDHRGTDLPYSAMYVAANRNKRSVAIDLAGKQGQDIVRRLAARCDVVVENFKVGDLARYGLDQQSLRRINPRLIYCSITGFGQTGPYRHRPAYDPIFQAMSGLMSVTGLPYDQPGGGPMKVGPSIADVIGGLFAGNAILAALHRRGRDGQGEYIDISLLDCMIAACSHHAQHYLISGEPPRLRGTEGNGGVPSKVYRCADGDIFVAVGNDRQFAKLCSMLSREELIHDPRYRDNGARSAHRTDLTEWLDAEFVDRPRDALLAELEAAGVPAAPISNFAEVFSSPHALHTNNPVQVTTVDGIDLKLIQNPIRFAHHDLAPFTAPPPVGADTVAVLAELLGLTQDQAGELAASIQSRETPHVG